MDDLITRLTWDGEEITAPAGTNKCAQTIGKPHPSDWTHWLFAPSDPGPMVQLLTGCGRRAHRFVLESEGKDVDCPECVQAQEAIRTARGMTVTRGRVAEGGPFLPRTVRYEHG